ncbi:MAG TPA: pyridoxamine 5'-phosphate oxidase family protein [Candidatus Saccharimonadales bacterium]|nr:pyridoxamine 5'-phosphate oxidase family protein [Candidatus Saccharimonadales bacterium]
MIPPERIARVQELLRDIHHVAIATVNDDGSPHNSPVFMAFDDQLHGYWSSHPDNLHSRNIARTHKVSLVIFDSRAGHGGLFVEATATVIEDPAQLKRAYNLLKSLKEQQYGFMGDIEQYRGRGQRLYVAKPTRFWLNMSEKDAHGAVIRDTRYEITPDDLTPSFRPPSRNLI